MLLTIDIGNSNVVLGVYQQDNLKATFRIEADNYKTSDEYASIIIKCLDLKDIDYHFINATIISSTKSSLNITFEKLCQEYFKTKAIFVGANYPTDLIFKIDEPATIGTDLLVGAVAANYKYGGNCLIIDMGTATTMTIVTAEKEYIGGCILPGLKTSSSALASKASALPLINFEFPEKVIGTNTIDAMQSGLMFGYAVMLDAMIDKFQVEFNKPLKIIVTGGMAGFVKGLKNTVIIDNDLLLDGLKYLYDQNLRREI